LEVWPEKSYIVRTAWLYGPYGRNFAKTILKKAIQTKDEIFVVDDQTGQPTSTFDLATRLFRISESRLPAGTFHGTNSGQATWWEFAREIVALSGNDVNRVIPVSSGKFPSKVNRPKFSVLDHSSWSKVGFEPMKDWRIALSEVFPRILDNVMKELASD
jgi:dTDP-4-dehydrorhamnose reductase